mgnify:CR=1 FL=1
MKESKLSLKEKTTQGWFYFCQIAPKYLNYFMTDLLNNIVDDLGIWLLGYMI